MKTLCNLLMIFLSITCLNVYAQNPNSVNSADSLKIEILNTLNNYKWTIYKGAIPEQLRLFNISDKITIENHLLVFKTEKGTETINLILSQINLAGEKWRSLTDAEWKVIALKIDNYYDISYSDARHYIGTKKQIKAEWNRNNEEVLKLYETLVSFQKEVKNEFYSHELASFKAIAIEYVQSSEKQTISEEQRKYIVQANSLTNEKNYYGAIRSYEKVNAINPVSYPATYYNIALLASQTNNFEYAVLNMKKYLMLVPNAEDARAAQDKIYEWELKIGS